MYDCWCRRMHREWGFPMEILWEWELIWCGLGIHGNCCTGMWRYRNKKDNSLLVDTAQVLIISWLTVRKISGNTVQFSTNTRGTVSVHGQSQQVWHYHSSDLTVINKYPLQYLHQTCPWAQHRHGQEGAFAPPPRNVTKCFCALVFTAKRRRIIYASFSQRIVCFWLQSPQIPGLHPRIALGDFRLQTPNCPPGKNPVGANERVNYKSNSNNLNAWLTAAQW